VVVKDTKTIGGNGNVVYMESKVVEWAKLARARGSKKSSLVLNIHVEINF